VSLSFAPLLHPGLLALLVVVYVALAIRFYRRIQSIVTPTTYRLLVACKVAAVILLIVVLLNPYWIRTTPDTRAFRVVLLADATGSMKTADCTDGLARLEILRKQLVGPNAPLRLRLAEQYQNLRTYVFADAQPRELPPNSDFNVLPGETDVDGALEAILAGDSRESSIGAVLLLSDGIDNSGRPIQEVAARFKQRGIPIHVVGIGDSRPRRDVGVSWTSVPKESQRAEDFQLKATVERNFSGVFDTTAVLFEDGREIARQPVTFAAEATAQPVEFQHASYVSGLKTYKIRLEGLDNEENVLNNVDFAGVSIRDPDRFRALYFSGTLGWQYRFLRRLAEDQERLAIDAIIRLGEDAWFSHGLSEESRDVAAVAPSDTGLSTTETEVAARDASDGTSAGITSPQFADSVDDETPHKGFPKTEQLNDYACMIVDLSGLYLLTEEDRIALTRFIDERGGGVLFTGDAPDLPEDLAKLLPVVDLPGAPTVTDRVPLRFPASRMFTGRRMTPVRELEGRLEVPAGSLLYRVGNEQVKPGATLAAEVKGPGWPILTGQNYGAGKVAWLNLTDTWKWVMHEDTGADDHAAFWGYTVAWLASSSRQRLTIRPRPSKFSVGSEQTIKVDFLNSRYQPENAANVSCTVIRPDGSDETLQFVPSPNQDGRYLAKFIPGTTGEYRLRFNAASGDEPPLQQVVDYVVVDQSPESQPVPLAEPQLQNLSRATSGNYWHYTDADKITELPLNKAVIQKTEQRWLRNQFWMLLLVAIGILPDWYYRRKTGLR
jgi:hypothetical protein